MSEEGCGCGHGDGGHGSHGGSRGGHDGHDGNGGCGCEDDAVGPDGHDPLRELHDASCGSGEDAAEGPADPQLDPTRSPGWGEEPGGLADIEVSRADVTIGEADPEELAASDTAPVADDAVADLVDQVTTGDDVERTRAALALGDVGDGGVSVARAEDTDADREAAVAALARAARTDDHSDVRQFAVESLGDLGGERAAAVAEAALGDDDPWVRAEAVVALDNLDREAHADAIDGALDDDHHAPRRNALVSQFKREGVDSEPTLLAMCDDPAERVREWAVHLLAGVDSEAATERLHGAREADSDIVSRTAENALETDARQFRRQFHGAMDGGVDPAASPLNTTPDL